MVKTVYLSLGSNVGDRRQLLAEAVASLPGVTRLSPIYETEPQDLKNQPWFLNQVAELETDLFPMQLLALIQKIERQLGRKRAVPKGPRTLDIDILFYGNAVIETAKLQVPHPRLPGRRFVLEPLAQLAPDLRHPMLKRSIRELLEGTQGQVVRRIP